MYLAAIIAVAGAGQEVVPSDYRLPERSESSDRSCRRESEADIIVCGQRRPRNYRVAPLPQAPRDTLMRSYDVGGGVTVAPEISQTSHQSGPFAGMVDRRVTVRVRVPF